MIANWQDACGPYLPDDITTPSALEATKTMDQDTCKTIVESCAESSQSVTSCFSAFSNPTDITSCRCQESIVSLASVCKIDGPNSCEGSIAITSDIWEFQNCEAAADVLKTTKESGPVTKKPEDSTNQEATATFEFGPASTVASPTSGVAVSGNCSLWFIKSLLFLLASRFIYIF
ncbi:hypothetical protein SNK03_000103 [Fusarium graminearum]